MAINNSLNNAFAADYNGLNKLSKNLIIGGNFTTNPWQRGTSIVSPAANAFLADRFAWNVSGTAVITATKNADSPTEAQANIYSTSCLQIAVTTADASIDPTDFSYIRYRIEGYDFTNIAQRIFTLSFWVNFSKTGIYCASFRNSSDRCYIAEYTVNSANTWEKKTITVTASPSSGTWDYTNGIGLEVDFIFACGSVSQNTANTWINSGGYLATSNQVNGTDSNTNVFKFALIQVECGEVATPFEQRLESEVVRNCQRYYQKTFPMATAPAQASGTQLGAIQYRAILTGIFANGQTWDFSSTMRATPTITYYNPISANTTWYNVTLAADSGASSPVNLGDRAVFSSNAQVAGDTATNNITIHATASAEI